MISFGHPYLLMTKVGIGFVLKYYGLMFIWDMNYMRTLKT